MLLCEAFHKGKTHLAIALGIRACMEGKTVRFFRCLDLANVLLEKQPLGNSGVLFNFCYFVLLKTEVSHLRVLQITLLSRFLLTRSS
ncbi:ATP-binding protein [Desulforamulus putei]|uniref:ATP-binding protein n=1 Tax=Desulforamulus putei TaxID=74701 RepID=UPI00236864A8|nr:ATP-binding protein [Desulforamulus putei]